VLVVKATNPLTTVTLTNLRAVFGSDCRDSAALRPWSVLNVSGSLARQPIHLVGFDLNSEEAMIFADTVLGNSPRWTCNYHPEQGSSAAARRIVDDVKHDPNALGITTLDRVTSEVKVLGLVGKSGRAIYPTAENLASGTYPLFRTVLAITRRPSKKYQDGTTANFLSFLASPQGQEVVASDDRFLPVPHAATADAVKAQR
jgi:ABC-type phosphate transport system substrate-binding protein